MHLLALYLALLIPTTFVYEEPSFTQTEFYNEYGIFRWYQGCWSPVLLNDGYQNCNGGFKGMAGTSSHSSSRFSEYSNRDRFGFTTNSDDLFFFGSNGSTTTNVFDNDLNDKEGILDKPLGLGCDSITDYRNGGALGPIPCTTYPGVLGPVPRY